MDYHYRDMKSLADKLDLNINTIYRNVVVIPKILKKHFERKKRNDKLLRKYGGKKFLQKNFVPTLSESYQQVFNGYMFSEFEVVEQVFSKSIGKTSGYCIVAVKSIERKMAKFYKKYKEIEK